MRVVWLCVSLLYLVLSTDGASKYVSVSLNSKWKSTPMLLEASEFLASEGNDNFWGFVTRITDLNPDLLAEETDEAMYHLIQKFSAKFLTPMLQNFLKMFLSLRAYSPTVEMFQHMADDAGPPDGCDAFVFVHGEKTCDADKIKGLVKSAANKDGPVLFKFDHVYPGGRDAQVTAILYGQLGTAAFKTLHGKLVELTAAGDVIYVYRHYLKVRSEELTSLSGYGVELAIKSTEYKAKDDTKVEGGDSGADEEEDAGVDVDGFVFSKLRTMNLLLPILVLALAVAIVPGYHGAKRPSVCLEDITVKETCLRQNKISRRFFNTSSCRCEMSTQCLEGDHKFKTKRACNRVCGDNLSNGNIGKWSSWSTCTVNCGEECRQNRQRKCWPKQNNPCGCLNVKRKELRTVIYEVGNGNVTPWSGWSVCGVDCGEDCIENRTRTCTEVDGNTCSCQGITVEEERNTTLEVGNGNVTPWSSWSLCNDPCDFACIISRNRTCAEVDGNPCSCNGVILSEDLPQAVRSRKRRAPC